MPFVGSELSMRWHLLVLTFLLTFVLGCSGKYVRPTTDLKIDPSAELLERGAYLVNQVAACGACHTGREHDDEMAPLRTDQYLGGGWMMIIEDMGVRLWMPNITNDPETGIGAWTDDEVIRAIRDGVNREGKPIAPMMPSYAYQYLSDEDTKAIVAYLRTVPPVRLEREREKNKIPFVFRLLGRLGAFSQKVESVPPRPTEDPVERGRYVARAAHCFGCHAMGPRGPLADDDPKFMSGSHMAFDVPGHGKAYATNLTSHETGLGSRTDEEIRHVLQSGRRFDGKLMMPPMSLLIPHVGGMTDEDMDDLIVYLRSLPPVEHTVPEREVDPEMVAHYDSVEVYAPAPAVETTEAADEADDQGAVEGFDDEIGGADDTEAPAEEPVDATETDAT
jgi:mono/diheme cytochrome c family protein